MQEDTTARLDELLVNRAAADEPGAAVGAYRNGSYAGGAVRGLASLEYEVAIGDDTVFDIATCWKQLTATCALLLAREGLVDLDADVRELVPELSRDCPASPTDPPLSPPGAAHSCAPGSQVSAERVRAWPRLRPSAQDDATPVRSKRLVSGRTDLGG